eukprot:6558935-Alexandrium_andersonii.AAC.1
MDDELDAQLRHPVLQGLRLPSALRVGPENLRLGEVSHPALREDLEELVRRDVLLMSACQRGPDGRRRQ